MNASRQKIEIFPEVMAFAKTQGISLHQLEDMCQKAALITHEDGNRRFHNWIMLVKQGQLQRITDVRTGVSSDTLSAGPKAGEFLMYDECPACHGETCERCDFTGQVPMVHRLPQARLGAMQ